MLVKKTKNGKFSFSLHFVERQTIYNWLISFLETESADILFVRLKNQNDVNRHLHYSVADALFRKHHANLSNGLGREEKFSLTRCEALVLLSLLASSRRNVELQELKSSLHKLLS